jgi:hypothetical protein
VSAEAKGDVRADTANAAKLRRRLSALLNDLDMKKSPMVFENTMEILWCVETSSILGMGPPYFQRTPLTQGYKAQMT